MQDAVAILIVACAAAFLARRAWLKLARRRAGACGSCGSCGSADSLKTRPLVTIATDFSHAKAQSRKG
jgi:hypothetical protein